MYQNSKSSNKHKSFAINDMISQLKFKRHRVAKYLTDFLINNLETIRSA